MTPEALVDLLRLFESAGIEVWLDGGWAVDALLGAQTRPHKDLDIILRVADLPKLREILARRGFEIRNGGTESNFVLADRSGLEVDVHAIVFDRDGNGVYRMGNGSDWIFPAAGFSGRGVFKVSVSAAFRQKSRCSAMLMGMCQQRKISAIWNCSRHASVLNYQHICGVIRSDAIVNDESPPNKSLETSP